MRQPDLARTVKAIAEGGPDAYYQGPIAEAIAGCVREHGGLLAPADLAAHAGEWVDPMRAPYRDLEVLELPPPTQGVTALEALRIVDASGELPPDGPERAHLLIEAVKLALADRDAHVTDPRHMRVDPNDLLARSWVGDRLGRIDPARAGNPGPATALAGGTAYLCAADADGMLVSLIQTNFNEFGSGLTVPGWGINLQNRGRSFSLEPAHANVVAPGKRSLHALIPALAMRGGAPWLVFGTMGGDTQAQIHVQLLTQIVDDGADIQAALDAPRWRVTPGTWEVEAESRFDPSVIAGLADRGHAVATVGPWDDYMGYAQAIVLDGDAYTGATDARAEGAVIGF
ncbi:MAG: gamma-glutamyltransferase [Actinobacteria bacterium]|nr:gamma-glutamyltransferase [Actinomycetota bacterium]